MTRTVNVERSYRVLVTTDKPLYQPGQTIHIRCLALGIDRLRPASGQKVVLEVQDAKGNKVFKQHGTTSAFGIFAADFVLADQVNMGDYTVSATVADTTSERGVTVKRYVLPKFKVGMSTDKGYYLPGQTVTIDLQTDYTFGKPVAGARVQVTAEEFIERFRPIAMASGRTDADGACRLEIKLPHRFVGQDLNKGDAIAKLTATVADAAGHVQKKTVNLTVTSRPIRIELFPESGELVRNVENVLYVVTAYPDGLPAKTTLTFANGKKAETTDVGIARIKITPGKQRLHLSVTAEDMLGVRSSVKRTLRVGKRIDAFLVRADRAVYRSGETANLTIVSAVRKGRVFLDVVKDGRTWLMKTIDVTDGRGSLALDLPPDLAGTLELHAYRLLPDGNMVRDVKVIQVNRADALTIAAKLDKETYRPGERAVLKFLVERKRGGVVQAALSLAGVDEAVFALCDLQPGLEQVYFMLQEEILKPRYEIHAHAPITPKQTVLTPETAVPETEEASVVLFSAAAGSDGPARTPGKNFAEKRAAVRKAKSDYFDRLWAGAISVPFVVYLLLALPVIGYAVLRLFRRRPIEGIPETDLLPLKRGMRSVAWRWIGGLYLPMLIGIGAVFACNIVFPYRYNEERWGILSGVLTIVVMLGLLFAAARRVRRCDAARATPLLRKAIWCVPLLYLFGVGALFCMFLGVAEFHLLDDDIAVNMLVATVILACFVWGAVSVAGTCALRGISKKRWFLIFLGRPLLAALPVVIVGLIIPAFACARERARMGEVVGMGAVAEMRFANAAPAAFDRAWGDKAAPLAPPTEEVAPPDSAPKLKAPSRIRRHFPETLFWTPELITDEDGKAQLDIPLADSITTWRIAMSAVSASGDLGSTTKGLRVFQDFFVDIDFPVALTQNDEVSVPIAVFNYLDKPQTVRLEAQATEWCEFLDESVKELQIGPKEVTSVYLPLKAVKPGRHALLVKAFGSEMADAVERRVRVVPDGRLVEQTVNGDLSENVSQKLAIPANAIDGASDLFVKIYPGAFSQVVEGLDGILRMPHGCFEQTSSSTYPNILVLDYMRRTKQIKPDIEMKALNYINVGYQRLVSYEVEGGGFDWFGRPPAHTILTAYGLMEFNDMAKVYEVDPAVIERTRKWLLAQRSGDGTWKPPRGGIVEGAINQFQGSAVLRSTAYITWALAEAGESKTSLAKSLEYTVRQAAEEKDPYTLALCANALAAADCISDAKPILRRLEAMKIEKDKTAHWTSASEGVTHSRGRSLDIETTALVAYAMIRTKVYSDTVEKALTWLVEKKDSFGTWHSTQATIHGMRALLAGTGSTGGVEDDMNVTVTANGKVAKELKITPETSDVFRLVSLRPFVREGENAVALEAAGEGSVAYQIVARHYVPWPREKTAARQALMIDVRYDATTVKKNDILTCHVAVQYNRPGVAMMTIVDLGIPPGFKVQTDVFEDLKRRGTIQRFSVTGRQVILYFDRISQGRPVKFSYRLKAKFPVRAKTPATVAYQYYEPELRAQAAPIILTVE